jgi:nucleoside-diphosphate-sugar epimerase
MFNWKEKQVLFTGGAGFIGSYLCEKLASLGSHVIIFDNFS